MNTADERKLELLDEFSSYEALQESFNIRIARYNHELNRPDLSRSDAERHLRAMQSLAELQHKLRPTDQDTIAALGLLIEGLEPELVTQGSQVV